MDGDAEKLSRLFVEVYLDEDVSVLVRTLLRSRGVQAQTTGDVGNYGKSDEEQERRVATPLHAWGLVLGQLNARVVKRTRPEGRG